MCMHAACRYYSCEWMASLSVGYYLLVPTWPVERSVVPLLSASTCVCCNHKCYTWGGYRSSQSSGRHPLVCGTVEAQQQLSVAVCGPSIFVCWMTGEAITGCHK